MDLNDAGEWSGFDRDLMDALAQEGQFTYQFENSKAWHAPGGWLYPTPPQYFDNWTNHLWDGTHHADVVLSYWQDDPYFHNIATLLSHHITTDWILMTPKVVKVKAPSFLEYVQTVVTPFTKELWAVICFALILNAVSAYVLDTEQFMRKHREVSLQEAILKSVYLSANQALGGDSLSSHSGRSKLLHLAWGCLLLVLLSWYTGIVATQLVVAQVTQDGEVRSVSDLIERKLPVCIHGADTSGLASLQAIYQNLKFEKVCATLPQPAGCVCPSTDNDCDPWDVIFSEMHRKLTNRECIAAAVPSADPNIIGWLKHSCDIVHVGQPLRTTYESLATNQESPCVTIGLNWALSRIRGTGKLREVYQKWFGRKVMCASSQSDIQSEPQQVGAEQVSGVFLAYIIVWVLCMMIHLGEKLSSTSQSAEDGTKAEAEAAGKKQEVDIHCPDADQLEMTERVITRPLEQSLQQALVNDKEALREFVRAIIMEHNELKPGHSQGQTTIKDSDNTEKVPVDMATVGLCTPWR